MYAPIDMCRLIEMYRASYRQFCLIVHCNLQAILACTCTRTNVSSKHTAHNDCTGLEQFSADIKKMLGFTPWLYFLICWKFISPLFLLVLSI